MGKPASRGQTDRRRQGGGVILHFIHPIIARLLLDRVADGGAQVRLVLRQGAGLPGFTSTEEGLPVSAYARVTPPTAKRTVLSDVRETGGRGGAEVKKEGGTVRSTRRVLSGLFSPSW